VSASEAPVAKVLVVDDDPIILNMINAFLTPKGYLCYRASNSKEALKIVDNEPIDIAIIDIHLGEESGIDLIQTLKKNHPKLPCIVITGFEDEATARLALDAGAYGYLAKPFSLLELLVNIEGTLRRQRLEELRDNYQDQLERSVRESTESLRISLDHEHRIVEGVIQAMAEVVEVRDPYTSGHQHRTASLALAISQVLGLPRETTETVYLSALLHDIGKISVPAEILTKPGKLDTVEFELVKRHPQVGFKILQKIPFSFPIDEIVYQHHERLDGSGYPRGLKGNDIRIEARILAVADVVEAMMSHRPYRPALGKEITLKEISSNREKLYDSHVVSACIELFTSQGFLFQEIEPVWAVQESGEKNEQPRLYPSL
jgi:putative nucleotidyltransferase with HDIG domain